MNQEQQQEVKEEVKVETTTQDYINMMNEIKKNSVPKEQYQKLLEENKTLIANIGTSQPSEDKPETKSAEELRKIIADPNTNNLEFCKASVELRDLVLKEDGKDIFVASSSSYTPSQDSFEAAARVAKVMQECIELADGDSERFTNELMARTNDVYIPRR